MPRTTGHSRIRETNRRPVGKKRKRKGSEIREDADVAEIKGELRERGVDFENCLRRRRDSIRRGLILGEEFVMVEGGANSMIVGSPGES